MAKYLRQKLDPATLDSIADFICGDNQEKFPEYRSSGYLTRFFQNIGINATHDGSTRKWWVLEILKQLSLDNIEKVVLRLVDIREYRADKNKLQTASKAMSDILYMENLGLQFQGRDPVVVPLKSTNSPIIDNAVEDLSEEEFLKKDFEENNITKINIDGIVESILKERVGEARSCVKNKIWLSSIFMCGSCLEGLLLGVASKYPKQFNQANSSPKKDGKIKPFHEWTLENFIDVSHEVGFIGLDVKKFSHAMRDFRNYIHPYQQLASKFSPDEHTAKMCLQALNAAIADLIKSQSKGI
jgi:hypothetical protein